jgi:hypothetical protein
MSKAKMNHPNKDSAEVAPKEDFTIPEVGPSLPDKIDPTIPLAIGDRVGLKGLPGPLMIIESLTTDAASVVWFVDNAMIKQTVRNSAKVLERR